MMPTDKLRLPTYGGQALLEGVLMRGSHYAAAAFRKPDGEIVIHAEELTGIYKTRAAKTPFLRGIVILLDALVLGTHFLVISANHHTGEDEKIEGAALYGTLAFSLIIGIGVFFVIPALIAGVFEKYWALSSFTSNMIEGVIRLAFFLIYIWAIGKLPDISRFFAYHGAEHKTINAYEANVDLTSEQVSQFSLYHPRCGTGFLLIVVIISIVIFALLGPLSILFRILTRIIFLPIIVILAYEYMRWTANHLDSPIIKILISPNLLLQKLTTREPSNEMLDVAITALRQLIELENNYSVKS